MTHTYYLGRDNDRALRLSLDGEAINHLNVPRWLLLVGDTAFDSDTDAGIFTVDDDRLLIELGAQALEPGFYRATLIVYSPDQPSGVVWGSYTVHILPDPA